MSDAHRGEAQAILDAKAKIAKLKKSIQAKIETWMQRQIIKSNGSRLSLI